MRTNGDNEAQRRLNRAAAARGVPLIGGKPKEFRVVVDFTRRKVFRTFGRNLREAVEVIVQGIISDYAVMNDMDHIRIVGVRPAKGDEPHDGPVLAPFQERPKTRED